MKHFFSQKKKKGFCRTFVWYVDFCNHSICIFSSSLSCWIFWTLVILEGVPFGKCPYSSAVIGLLKYIQIKWWKKKKKPKTREPQTDANILQLLWFKVGANWWTTCTFRVVLRYFRIPMKFSSINDSRKTLDPLSGDEPVSATNLNGLNQVELGSTLC